MGSQIAVAGPTGGQTLETRDRMCGGVVCQCQAQCLFSVSPAPFPSFTYTFPFHSPDPLTMPPPPTMLSSLRFPEPPTLTSLGEARRELASQKRSVKDLTQKIHAAEENLARLIQESKCAIQQMEKEKEAVESDMAQMLAYISPIKRLPHELLRHIFYMNFEDLPCCAWVLAAVCKLWRRLALSMPRIWSKVCHFTSPPHIPLPHSFNLCSSVCGSTHAEWSNFSSH